MYTFRGELTRTSRCVYFEIYETSGYTFSWRNVELKNLFWLSKLCNQFSFLLTPIQHTRRVYKYMDIYSVYESSEDSRNPRFFFFLNSKVIFRICSELNENRCRNRVHVKTDFGMFVIRVMLNPVEIFRPL